MNNEQISNSIEFIVEKTINEKHAQKPFIPGESSVPVTGKVFDKLEIIAAIRASLDFWLTSGPETEKFERDFAKYVNMRHAFMVNSGSSANLVALSALTSNKLGERSIRPGDEVLTVAAGFPTTVTPILQNNLVPVYVDVDLGTYVANIDMLESAISNKTKAIMIDRNTAIIKIN